MSTVKKYFIKKCASVFVGASLKDYCTYYDIKTDIRNAVKDNFCIAEDEEILFVRDTSLWNNRTQGTVITNKKIYFIADNKNSDNRIILDWRSIENVEYENSAIRFNLNIEGEKAVIIPIKCFLKKLSEKELIGYEVAHLLVQISELVKQNEKRYMDAYKLFLENDGKITGKERFLLNLLREKYELSAERANELESMVKIYTKDKVKSFFSKLSICSLALSSMLGTLFKFLWNKIIYVV